MEEKEGRDEGEKGGDKGAEVEDGVVAAFLVAKGDGGDEVGDGEEVPEEGDGGEVGGAVELEGGRGGEGEEDGADEPAWLSLGVGEEEEPESESGVGGEGGYQVEAGEEEANADGGVGGALEHMVVPAIEFILGGGRPLGPVPVEKADGEEGGAEPAKAE